MARHSVMVRQVCSLHPFASELSPTLSIRVEFVWRESGQLELSFGLRPLLPSGDLEELLLPPLQPTPQRLDDLWQHTCFEAFLGLPGSPCYWELNVSPSGDWNLYAFDAYRVRREPVDVPLAVEQPPSLTLQRGLRDLRGDIQLPLHPWWPPGVQPELGLAMVVEEWDGRLSTWALRHPAEQADFHDRRAFLSF
jgi:hypothetical protein